MSLYLDNITEIISYLGRKELYYLSQTSTFYYQLIRYDQLIINTIHKRLKTILNEHYETFMQLMIDNNAFISGSFIIQCILNEDWSNISNTTDIDIYVPYNDNNVRGHIFENGTQYYYNTLEDYIFSIMDLYEDNNKAIKRYTIRKNDRDLPTITNVRSYDNPEGAHLQVISIDKDDGHFYDAFDFDVCKNMYYPGKKLFIYNMDNVLNKVTTFNATFNLRLSIARYYKYINYGFTFTKQDISYKNLQHADNCDIMIQAEDINNVPEHIKKIIPIRKQKKKYDNYDECIQNECFLHFIDPTIKHLHKIGYKYDDRHRSNYQSDHIIIVS